MDFSFRTLKLGIIWLLFLGAVDSIGSYYYNQIEGTSSPEILNDDVFFEILEPTDLSYTYRTRPARGFGSAFDIKFPGQSARLVPAEPPGACNGITNGHQISGHIALVLRGDCTFVTKALQAQKAGAKGVIIANNYLRDNMYVEMGSEVNGFDIDIPAAFILGYNGYMIRKTLAEKKLEYAVINIPVNLTYVSIDKMNQPPWSVW